MNSNTQAVLRAYEERIKSCLRTIEQHKQAKRDTEDLLYLCRLGYNSLNADPSKFSLSDQNKIRELGLPIA